MEDYVDQNMPNPYYFNDLTTQTSLDAAICDDTWAKSQTLDGSIYYSEDASMTNNLLGLSPSSSDAIVGIALNGVFLFAGTSIYGYDAFFPKAHGN